MKLLFLIVSYCLLISCALAQKPSLRGLVLEGPGTGEFQFNIESKPENPVISVTMKLNQTLLTMETSIQYNKYFYKDETSNLAEFKYYKSCFLTGITRPSYTISDNQISLVIGDAFEPNVLYNFKLTKVELSSQEKIDLMFNVMNNEIRELKDRLWFLDPSMNKIAKGRGITSNDQSMISFIEGKTSTYTGIYQSEPMANIANFFIVPYLSSPPSYMYDRPNALFERGNSPSSFTKQLPLIQLPRHSTIKKISFKISNGGTCPYTEPINFNVRVFTSTFAGPLRTIHNVYHRFDNHPFQTTVTRLNDGFTRYDMELPQYLIVVDGIGLFINTNGLRSPSGTSFDGVCNYILKDLVVY